MAIKKKAMILFISLGLLRVLLDEGDGALLAAAVFLAVASKREPSISLEDVKTAPKCDAPAVVKVNHTVMIGIEVMRELDSDGCELVFQIVEDVYHLGDFLIIRIASAEVDLQLFGIAAAFTAGLNEIHKVVNLERVTYEWVGDLYFRR